MTALQHPDRFHDLMRLRAKHMDWLAPEPVDWEPAFIDLAPGEADLSGVYAVTGVQWQDIFETPDGFDVQRMSVWFQMSITFSSTVITPSVIPKFRLPFQAQMPFQCSALLHDVGTRLWPATLRVPAVNDFWYGYLTVEGGFGGNILNNSPFTWVDGDEIFICGEYMAGDPDTP